MAERKTAAKKAASKGSGPGKGFTEDERAAMKARAKELKAEERASKNRAEGERQVVEAIAGMNGPDRAMAKRIHELVTTAAPDLAPRTWYGMPAYTKNEKVVCFFKNAGKFKSRYATFGFEEAANLDDGEMWPTSYALTKLTPADEKKLTTLVKKAAR